MCGASSGDCKGDFQRLEYLPCSPASCSSLSFRFWAEFRVAGIARPVRCIDEMQTGVAVAYCLPMHAVLISPGKAGKAGLRRLGRDGTLCYRFTTGGAQGESDHSKKRRLLSPFFVSRSCDQALRRASPMPSSATTKSASMPGSGTFDVGWSGLSTGLNCPSKIQRRMSWSAVAAPVPEVKPI